MNNSKKGFSFIELVVALGILGLLIPVLFSLFFVSLQSQSKTRVLQEVKRNGDFVLSQMEYYIKNDVLTIYSDQGKTTEVCTTNSSTTTPSSSATVYFADRDNNLFYYALSGTQIASYSAVLSPNPALLTNARVEASNFVISCTRTSTFSPPVVSVSFTVSNLSTANRHEEKATLNYQTKIKLRNY